MSHDPRVALLPVRVTARAGRDAIEGVIDGRLRLRVAASPVGGAANAAVVRLIADTLSVPPSTVRIASGAAARHKTISIDGLPVGTLLDRWPDLRV